MTGAGADVATDFQKRRRWRVRDLVLFVGHCDITASGDLGHQILFFYQNQIITPGVETQN